MATCKWQQMKLQLYEWQHSPGNCDSISIAILQIWGPNCSLLNIFGCNWVSFDCNSKGGRFDVRCQWQRHLSSNATHLQHISPWQHMCCNIWTMNSNHWIVLIAIQSNTQFWTRNLGENQKFWSIYYRVIAGWTLLHVYKQVVMNMSIARDPRGDKVITTPPRPHALGFSAVVMEMGMHMMCTFLNKMTT